MFITFSIFLHLMQDSFHVLKLMSFSKVCKSAISASPTDTVEVHTLYSAILTCTPPRTCTSTSNENRFQQRPRGERVYTLQKLRSIVEEEEANMILLSGRIRNC